MTTTTGTRTQAIGIGLGVAIIFTGSVSAIRQPNPSDWYYPPVSVAAEQVPGSLRIETSRGQDSIFLTGAFATPARISDLSIGDLRDLSGLTASQVARLFGVSRRSVNHWLAGKPMAPQHEERLSFLLATVQGLSGDTPDERRSVLLGSSNGMSLFHQLVQQAPAAATLQVNPISPSEQF